MSNAQLLQSSFTAGELSPSLAARIDFARYSQGCRTLKNFLVHPHGGASKRPGFSLLGNIPGEAVLIPFVFNNEQSYCLIFGDKWMRICTDEGFILNEQGQILQLATPYSLQQARQMSWTQSGDIMYLACRGIAPQKLKRRGHAAWEFNEVKFTPPVAPPIWLKPSSTAYDMIIYTQAYKSGTLWTAQTNGRVVNEDLFRRLTINMPSNPLGYAIFVNNARKSDGTVSPATCVVPYTYYITGVTHDGQETELSVENNITGPASNNWQVGDYIVLLWNTSVAFKEYRIYKSEYQGQPGLIATCEGFTYSDHNNMPDYSEGPPHWRQPFVARPGEEGLGKEYPGVVCFFEQRLVYASSINQPQTVWLSASGDYENFSASVPVKADDSLELTIASNEVSVMQWMVALRSLMIGANGMEWELTGADGALTARNARAIPQSQRGSYPLRALVVGSTILHVTRSGKEIRDFKYDFSTDSYGGTDKTILAQHLFERHKIVDWAYQPQPGSIIWVVRDDGVLLGLTFNPEHEVFAWHQHSTQGQFKSVCSLPVDSTDLLFAIVKRNGQYFVEHMNSETENGAGGNFSGVYLDCALELKSAQPVSIIHSLDHLEGMTVCIWADGKEQTPKKVANGSIQLDAPALHVVAGLNYSAELETMPLEAQMQAGLSVGRRKKLSAVNIHFKDSIYAQAGPDFEHLEEIRWPKSGGNLERHSGIQRVLTGTLGKNLSSICIKSDKPYPLHILAVMPELAVY